MRAALRTLSKIFDREAELIVNSLTNIEGYSSEVFYEPLVFSSLAERPNALRGMNGVYIFLLTEEIELTSDQVRAWNHVKGAGLNSWQAMALKQSDCLYVGSCCRQSLFTRIRHHFLGSGEVTALKLGHENRQLLLNSVQVYAYPIKSGYNEYMRLVVTSIEERLHQCLHPKAGSSRV